MRFPTFSGIITRSREVKRLIRNNGRHTPASIRQSKGGVKRSGVAGRCAVGDMSVRWTVVNFFQLPLLRGRVEPLLRASNWSSSVSRWLKANWKLLKVVVTDAVVISATDGLNGRSHSCGESAL
ncbi:hypothetical protein EVAR_18370_1 [Eumeta japonica]|uniref:Uncharacterized protein n=1 Tax=Eumeta variegata TaxID=151549 RepID=A0A4C1UTU7_EUMVA|nr:hypothetical protein EVAR_18370_1 [Eumeta japonica]